MRRLFACTALVSSLIPVCHALDLAEAYQQALSNDPQWSAVTNSYKAENEKEGQSKGALLPTVSLSGSLYENHFDPDNSKTLNYVSNQLSLQLRQPLFRMDLWRDYQRAKTATSVNEANYQQKRQEQILRVSQAYVDALRAEETLAATQSEEAALKRQWEQAQKRFDVGLIAKTDVLDAQAQMNSATANRISAEAQVASTREALSAIIGQAPKDLVPLRADFVISPPQPDSSDDWAKLAQEKNPQVVSARLSYQQAQEVQNYQRSSYYPQVDFVSNVSNTKNHVSNTSSLAFNNGNRMSMGVELQWPLYTGGRTSNAVRQAALQADAARDQVTSAERQLGTQARTAYLNVSADNYRVAARQQAVKSTEAALAATKAGYEVGTRNIVDVLLAERNLYSAKRDYANARYDYVINTLKLRAASGQLSDVDIKELNSWLGR